jgi:hypothetical protein
MPASAELALAMATDGHDPHITAISSQDPVSGCLAAKAPAFPANEKGVSNRRAPDRTLDNPPCDVVGRRGRCSAATQPSWTDRSPPPPIGKNPRHDHGREGHDPTATARRTSRRRDNARTTVRTSTHQRQRGRKHTTHFDCNRADRGWSPSLFLRVRRQPST